MPDLTGQEYEEGPRRDVYFLNGRGGVMEHIGSFPTILDVEGSPFDPLYVAVHGRGIPVEPVRMGRYSGCCVVRNPDHAKAMRAVNGRGN